MLKCANKCLCCTIFLSLCCIFMVNVDKNSVSYTVLVVFYTVIHVYIM